ncbi:MAG: hypothetical protein WA418_13060 [Bradyrhizobium sp.]
MNTFALRRRSLLSGTPLAGAALCLLTFSTMTFAADLGSPLPSNTPRAGFFLGLGGSYNSVNFGQDLSAAGISNVYSGTTLVAFGQAGGPANPFHDTQSSFAPEAQAGYFQQFAGSRWLWGVKFKYKYLGVTSTQGNVDSPQTGSFTNTGAAPPDTTFTGNVVIQSSQTRINHEFDSLAFLGHSFGNSTVYLGAGPALFGTTTNLYRATGFAAINGVHYDITGTPADFSSSKLMWGGAAQIGTTYSFDPSWFLDLNYTYAMTRQYTNNYSGPFASAAAGYTDTGTLFISTSQRVTSQAFAVSINKVF